MRDQNAVAYHVTVFGRVQGVGFRYSARIMAHRCAVTGWVRNASDGSVEIVCEGDRTRVAQFLRWLRKGPPGAYVTNMKQRKLEPTGAYPRFTVEF